MKPRDLYGLPLERFVPERTTLAKTLRGQGDRDEAARVAKLAKPSLAAWAVNQLTRTQSRAVEELFAAGDALQQAQQDVIAGRGGAASLRDATERERTAASALLDVARGLLSSDGHSLTPATLDRVSDTLHAAALDDGARREVGDGCLTRELRHVGLGGGDVFGSQGPAPASRKRASANKRAADGRKRQGATPTAQAAERKQREAIERAREQRRRAARAEVAAARRALEAAERSLRSAEQRRDRAAAAMREAEDAVNAAESRVDEAAQASEAAQRALDQI